MGMRDWLMFNFIELLVSGCICTVGALTEPERICVYVSACSASVLFLDVAIFPFLWLCEWFDGLLGRWL